MSIEKVKAYFEQFGREKDVIEFETSSATVELAAEAAHVIPARITKTLAFQSGDSCILIATAGDAKIDNKKFKAEFSMKASRLSPDKTLALTGHGIGGVCPFAVPETVKTYVDVSLKRFTTVFPAAGSSNSAIELTCDELFEYGKCEKWIDVCKGWEETEI